MHKDLCYFKTKEEQKHRGIHNLSGLFKRRKRNRN